MSKISNKEDFQVLESSENILQSEIELKKAAFLNQFRKCEPPPEIKKRLEEQSVKIKADKKVVLNFLKSLPILKNDELVEDKSQTLRVDLPLPPGPRSLRFPQWNSVALFYNLSEEVAKPGDYGVTTVQDVQNWMDEGGSPSNPTIRNFTYDYWNALSYGNLRFSIQVVRDVWGAPIVPTITPSLRNAHDYPNIAEAIIRNNPEGVWRAGGSVIKDGKRFIPSVCLVHKYWGHAWAWFGAWLEFSAGGATYLVGDFTHIILDLAQTTLPGGYLVRQWGHPLFHEFAHNFIEGGDLYGPGGCTGYWDILGDYLGPGLMAESCSLFKEKLGWIRFKEVINGHTVPLRSLSLRPYTTTGDAYKIVPDPVNNPFEYFLLEYRKSTGVQPHVPDGGLEGEGLLITHINERFGQWAKPWMLREAPFFDPEYADYSDFGEALWHGIAQKDEFKVLYPRPTNNSFTPVSSPNSDFYGGRSSGLAVTNIRLVDGICHFDLQINCESRIGWTVGPADRGLAGRFSNASSAVGQEIFLRNADSVALLTHRGGQVFVQSHQDGWIDGWNLGSDNREIVGDFDGDGRDEIFIRSAEWAGLFKYYVNRFRCDALHYDWIHGWNLSRDNWELAADLDGDGRDEIYIRSPKWAGVITYNGGRFSLRHIVNDAIDTWRLGADNQEFVGRFSQSVRDEILIKSPEWLGLIYWDSASMRLRLRQIQHDWIDGWNLGPNDKLHVADLDGDGLSEVYIRSAEWAGVLKWNGERFQVLWMTHQFIPFVHDGAEYEVHKVQLTAADNSYAGKFFPNKDGILHRKDDKVALLIWENSRMNVRFGLGDGYLGPWRLGAGDKFILGDFHKVGIEGHVYDDARREVLPYDHITNNLTDIFIHNGWGTSMLCLNYVPTNFSTPYWAGSEFGLTWMHERFLLYKL